jgi:copper chaperone
MEFKVPDMSCGHCTAAIAKSVKSADPAAAVDCDLGQRLVTIDSGLPTEAIGAAIRDAGYNAEPVSA